MISISDDNLNLLYDYQTWNEGKPNNDKITIFNYLCFNATPDLLFGFSSLFFIDLIFHEGNYFIKERFNKSVYLDWKNQLRNETEIQRVMNHIHIISLFQNHDLELDLILAMANHIKAIWNKVFKDLGLEAEVHGRLLEDISITLVGRAKTGDKTAHP